MVSSPPTHIPTKVSYNRLNTTRYVQFRGGVAITVGVDHPLEILRNQRLRNWIFCRHVHGTKDYGYKHLACQAAQVG